MPLKDQNNQAIADKEHGFESEQKLT